MHRPKQTVGRVGSDGPHSDAHVRVFGIAIS